jgi:predicted membrane-bound mannosyltransferase
MSRLLAATGLAALFLTGNSGCASTDAPVAEPASEKVYRTGSNLPARGDAAARTTTVNPEAVVLPQRAPRTGGN